MCPKGNWATPQYPAETHESTNQTRTVFIAKLSPTVYVELTGA